MQWHRKENCHHEERSKFTTRNNIQTLVNKTDKPNWKAACCPWWSSKNERSELKHSAGAAFFSFSWGTRSFSFLSERKEKEWVQKKVCIYKNRYFNNKILKFKLFFGLLRATSCLSVCLICFYLRVFSGLPRKSKISSQWHNRQNFVAFKFNLQSCWLSNWLKIFLIKKKTWR